MDVLPNKNVLKLGTRGSVLARMQSGLVANALERLHPGLKVELIVYSTSGDQIVDRPLHEVGGKGLFTKELEQALLNREVDFAVHSMKDVPVTMPLVSTDALVMAAIPQREDPRDALIAGRAMTLRELPKGAKVGTGSLRRRCQVLALRPDLVVENIRGNVDTRIRKQAEGQYDAVILAMAGLRRSGLFNAERMAAIAETELLPAAAQGALALQCRRDDARTRTLLGAMNHPPTALCVEAERAVVMALQGDCHSPIAALATIAGNTLTLRAAVGSRDGEPPVIAAESGGPALAADSITQSVVASLMQQGAAKMLQSSPAAGLCKHQGKANGSA